MTGNCTACAVMASIAVALMTGCESVTLLTEPDPLPTDTYNLLHMNPVRSGIMSSVDCSDCMAYALLTKDTLWGTVEDVANVPLRDVAYRGFNAVCTDVFRAPMDSECPDVTINVSATQVLLKKIGGNVNSRVEFHVRAVKLNENKPVFEGTYGGSSESEWDGVFVPPSIYESVRQAVTAFRQDLYKRLSVLEENAALGSDGHSVQGPSFLSFEIGPLSDAGLAGSCRIACNDWDSSRAANWLRSNLENRAREQLGIPIERVRIIYEENNFDAGKSEWFVQFKAFARVPWFLDYNQKTRTGVCAVDLELADLSAQQGAEKMKEYVMQEMNRRGVVVVDGEESSGAGVRFDGFTTDEHYNVIRCTFKLVN